MKKTILLLFTLSACFASRAQDTTAISQKRSADPVPEPAPAPGKFTFSGYMDTYYFGNFNKPSDQLNTGVGGGARAFDQRAGQFGIGLVQAKAVYSASKVDAVMDLTFGPFSDLGNYGNYIGPLGPGSTSLAIKQAYITYKATSKLSFTAGQFGTHIGYEVIDAPVNFNYSLSNLFNNGPFYHIGLKAQYAFSDRASLMVGLVNNVDNLFDNNRKKGLISQLFFSPVSGWNVYLNAIVSNEASEATDAVSADDASYALFDLTTTYQISPKFFVGLNAASGSQKGDYQRTGGPATSQSWGGVAVYSNYAISDKFALGARYETFDNTNGARALRDAAGIGVSVNSFTVTGNITAADGHLLFKPELRIDSYSADKFPKENGSLTTSQATLGMAAIFKF